MKGISMSSVNRPTRKITDDELLRLNSLGFSLATIAEMHKLHPSTITQRLRSLGVKATDTRRSFMEDILDTFPKIQRDWLAEQLGPHHSVKDYVRNLLIKDYVSKNQTKRATAV